jgi:methionyl-tRNA formyltransferase
MLKEIVLLTGQTAQQHALTALLKAHNPALAFRYAVTAQDLEALAPETLGDTRLLAFTSGTIVPRNILEALGHGAYNFHPGPSDRPGWAPAHFALYERARTFGATAHLMEERVDAGPIIGVETFNIPEPIHVRELEQIAFIRLAYLFWRLSRELATRSEPMPTLPIAWSGGKSTRHMYTSACQIPLDISKADLERRVLAFQDDFRGIHPTITLHGFEFQLVAKAAPRSGPSPDPHSFDTPLAITIDAPPLAMAAGAQR